MSKITFVNGTPEPEFKKLFTYGNIIYWERLKPCSYQKQFCYSFKDGKIKEDFEFYDVAVREIGARLLSLSRGVING